MFCSSKQITALHIAAQEDGLAEMCQLLINAKADVNARDRCAFMFKICCWFCFVLCFWNLLLIFCSSYDWTPLHNAATRGNMPQCQLLIDAKADVNGKRCAFMLKICCWFCFVFPGYCVFEICFWFSVLVAIGPLWWKLQTVVSLNLVSCWLMPKPTWMRQTGAHLCLKFVADFVLYFVFEICLWFFVPVIKTPLWFSLPLMVKLKRVSCWLMPKPTWMRQTGAHLCLKFVADFELYYSHACPSPASLQRRVGRCHFKTQDPPPIRHRK